MKKLLPGLLVLILLFSSCGGLQPVSSLSAKDFLSDKVVQIPIAFNQGNQAGAATSMKTEKSISELGKDIQALSTENCSYDSKEYAKGRMLIKIKQPDGSNAIMCIIEQTTSNDASSHFHSYSFFNMGAQIYGSKVVPTILLPYHLVDDPKTLEWYNPLAAGTNYSTPYDMNDFIDFYKGLIELYPEIGAKDIQVFDNCFVLSSKFIRGGEPLSTAKFSFNAINGKNYFSVQLYDGTETDVSSAE